MGDNREEKKKESWKRRIELTLLALDTFGRGEFGIVMVLLQKAQLVAFNLLQVFHAVGDNCGCAALSFVFDYSIRAYEEFVLFVLSCCEVCHGYLDFDIQVIDIALVLMR